MTSNLSPKSPVDVSVDNNIGNQKPQWSNLQSPWARVVRGGSDLMSDVRTTMTNASSNASSLTESSSNPEKTINSDNGSSETVSAETSKNEPDNSDRNNGDAAVLKKPAWNKPSNGGGVVESSSVMGGTASWPALSESTKPTPKSSSDASKSSSDGSASTSQVPIVSETLQRQVNSNANVNSTPNHGLPRQRSMRRGSGGGSSNGTSGGPPQVGYNRAPPPPPPLPPSFPAMGLLPPYGTFVAPILDTPPPVRGVRPMGGLRPQSGSDQSSQPQPQRSPRRNGFGPRPRGDGQHNHNNGGRRDSDRVPHQFIPPGPYIPPPPPGSASFIAPPNMRPFMTPMGYDMTSPYMIVPTLGPEPFRGIPFISQAPAAPMFYPTADMHLPNMIVRQIDYYFSDANLVRDNYLRSNMDEDGWVPIDLIANFPRVQQMTTDIQMILDSLRTSAVVEVQGNKIRRREDWDKWVHKSTRASADSGSQPSPAAVPQSDTLSASIQQMSLNSGSTRGSEDTTGSRTQVLTVGPV